MNPLSSRYYFYKNKWNLLPIVIVLSVQIGIIIFIISIGLTLLKGVAFCGYLEREHLVYVDKSDQITEEEQQSIYEEIKTYKNTQGVLEGSIGYMSTKLIFFNVEAGVLLGLKPQAIEEAMEHLGMQLMEGRLPVNQSEIIITEQGLRAAKAKIGDTLGEGNLLEIIP